MRPTEILTREHRVIEQVLNCLEAMANRVEAGQELDVESAHQAIDFFRNFADRCHHGKEEDCLFPLLEQKGFSREQGPTGVMLSEHEAGRNHVRGMAEALDAAASDAASSGIAFVSHARGFVQLLREHIQKEDHCLFPMSDQTLQESEQQQLLESFNKVEQDDMGPGTHEKYLALAEKLSKRFGIPCSEAITSSCSGSCGHHGTNSN